MFSIHSQNKEIVSESLNFKLHWFWSFLSNLRVTKRFLLFLFPLTLMKEPRSIALEFALSIVCRGAPVVVTVGVFLLRRLFMGIYHGDIAWLCSADSIRWFCRVSISYIQSFAMISAIKLSIEYLHRTPLNIRCTQSSYFTLLQNICSLRWNPLVIRYHIRWTLNLKRINVIFSLHKEIVCI